MTAETPDDRVQRWLGRDAAIGLAAENEQLRAQLAERDAELADLRARIEQLRHRVAQLQSELPRAARLPAPGRSSLPRRVVRRLRRVAAR